MLTKEPKDLQAELHQIKGVAANFGLASLLEVVVAAEAKTKAGDIEGAVVSSSQISPIWEETEKELKARFGK